MVPQSWSLAELLNNSVQPVVESKPSTLEGAWGVLHEDHHHAHTNPKDRVVMDCWVIVFVPLARHS